LAAFFAQTDILNLRSKKGQASPTGEAFLLPTMPAASGLFCLWVIAQASHPHGSTSNAALRPHPGQRANSNELTARADSNELTATS
jgi:hypothetical protein